MSALAAMVLRIRIKSRGNEYMSTSFVAIDFETANAGRASACAVGIVKVVDGVITETFSSLIRPHGRHSEFGKVQVSKHGITADQVQSAPNMREIWPQVEAFIGDFPLVAHNASFDFSVLQKTLRSWNILIEAPLGYCTYLSAKQRYSLISYRLPDLVNEFHLNPFNHHDALADARACAELALHMMSDSGQISSLYRTVGVNDGFVSKAKIHQIPVDYSDIDLALFDFSSATFLDGKHVLFTGTPLGLREKSEGWFWVEALGGIVEKNWTSKVNILVTCTQDPRQLKEGHDKSSKHEKAEAALAKGQNIEIIEESMFLSFLPNLKSED
jgi:DNA polymerase-3 subunit epsilon